MFGSAHSAEPPDVVGQTLSCRVSYGDGLCVLALSGVLDPSGYRPLRTAVTGLLDPAPTDRIEVDLHLLRMVDAGGVRQLLWAHDSAHAAGAVLVVTRPRELVHQVLDVLDVLDQLTDRAPRPGGERPGGGPGPDP